MNPISPPPTRSPSTQPSTRTRRRPDLTLPLPHRNPSLAVPLPLPPSSAPSTSSSSAPSTTTTTTTPPTNSLSSSTSTTLSLSLSSLERITRIGSGAGGTVYKVLHRPTSQTFALKVIYGNHDDAVRRQICREIEILRSASHPNVVSCFDMFDHNGEIQVLLEYMDGGSLENQLISDEKVLSHLCKQVLSGLLYLHRRRIVHRDIKPSNLLINSKKHVKIADFGVSRILAQTMDPCNSSVGTIAYMSPERINTDLNDGQYDGYAGDIWSFGVSVLEFYLGRFPFSVGRQGDWASLMVAICMAAPPEAPGSASREFRDFIRCCLQREPAKRWTAAKLLNHPFIVVNTSPRVAKCVNGGGSNNSSNHQGASGGGERGLMLPPPPPTQS